MKNNAILLSFDLEEFDIPEEYGQKLALETKLRISTEGVIPLLDLLEKYQIRATFFVTAFYAEKNKLLIQNIALRHEIASHGYFHSSFEIPDLKSSREKLEEITQKKVYGFRMARLKPLKNSEVAKAGYLYNTSMNPTYLPNRYNHLSENRLWEMRDGIFHIPVSVTPALRFPLFWLSLKNFPLWLINRLSAWTLAKDGYLSLYYHPWEFAEINDFDLPFYVKGLCGQKMLEKMENYIRFLAKKGNFMSYSDFIEIE
ncbi:MAG: DUF3473 domain-containing protein [Bacteroidetes bacterium]|nr:MAG: DUF3473 domain-containing protein [Bacteroidota bacterium]